MDKIRVTWTKDTKLILDHSYSCTLSIVANLEEIKEKSKDISNQNINVFTKFSFEFFSRNLLHRFDQLMNASESFRISEYL